MPGLTSNQQRAVAATGNVLVVAGAGTGKTRTLVERCLARILDPTEPVSLDELLVVTFTEAAAAEMRQRLRKRLEEERQRQPGNLHLAEQAALTDSAAISTLHSFCLRLVQEHFHQLGLDPQTTVLQESQAQMVAERALDEVLSRHYAGSEEPDLAVQELVMTYGEGRDDRVRSLVHKLHAYAQTLPDAGGWLASLQETFSRDTCPAWQTWWLEGARSWGAEWIIALGEVPAENARAGECLRLLAEPAPYGSREGVTNLLGALLTLDGNWPPRKKTAWRRPLQRLFEEAAFLHSLAQTQSAPVPGACATEGESADSTRERARDPLAEDWAWIRPHMKALVELTLAFDAAFASAKRELAAVDFHDLEQLALRLLWNADAETPTRLAQRWREKLRHVLVDEYQDINAAQDRILRGLSRDAPGCGNRFLVGDVKQSIYRFRLANPDIFQRYASEWAGPNSRGTVIPLNENFRSREPILRFANGLFTALMRPGVTGVPYDDEAALRPGPREAAPTGTPDPAPAVEVVLRLKAGRNSGPTPREPEGEAEPDVESSEAGERSDAETEAALVARRLRSLKDLPFLVWDEASGGRRPVEWRDMVVLLRAPRGKAESYARVFAEAGVPLWAKRTGLYETLEVSDLLSVLRLLDNPLQDLPLLAVLRSPLVGLTANELAAIRLGLRGEAYWTALAHFQQTARPRPASPEPSGTKEEDPETASGCADPLVGAQRSAWPKVDEFLKRHDRWRELARMGSLSQCLETILDETGYESWLRQQPRGRQRLANVERLLAMAREFDRLQRQGLFRFLQLVEAHRAIEHDPEPAPVEAANAVRLMSIHQSKGLEFPIVVVADLGKAFNVQDLRASVILDEQYGLAPVVKSPEAEGTYPSLPHWLAARRGRRELVAEELRLLYVALTRAQEKLVLVGTVSQRRAEQLWEEPALSSPRVREASSALEWIVMALPNATGAGNWWEQPQGASETAGWTIVSGPADLRESPPDKPQDVPEPAPASRPAPANVSRPAYRDLPATLEPAKASVSSLRRRAVETEEVVYWFRPLPAGRSPEPTSHAGTSVLSAAERGTAHHRALELVRLDSLRDPELLAAELATLQKAGQISATEVEGVDLSSLVAFGRSELGQRLRDQAAFVRRELEFTMRLTPADFEALDLPCTPGLGPEEFVVVQGVIDLAVVATGGTWIVDFKTDAVSETSIAAKVQAYTPQLRLYALALERLFGRPVEGAWLHFLALNRSVPVALGPAPKPAAAA